jgi:hypothetical protein
VAIATGAGLPVGVIGGATAQQSQPNAPPPLPSFSGFRGSDAALSSAGGSNIGPTPTAGSSALIQPDPTAGLAPPPPPTSAPNYGRPLPPNDPRLKYTGRAKTPRKPLPLLVPYPTSVQARQRPVQAQQPIPPQLTPQPPVNVAVPPLIPRKSPPRVEVDPYAPIGIGVGSLRLTPYAEVDVGYDTNPNRTPTPIGGSWLLRGETGFALKSDWSTHELTGSGQFGYSKYFSQPDADRPDGQGKLDLRLNATRDWTIDLETRAALATQRPGTPGVGVNVTNRPIVATFGASAGATRDVGTLQLGLKGTVDRTAYQDGALSNGSTVPLSFDNYTAFGVQPRIAYQLTPGIIPFIEGTVDARKRDNPVDLLGFARDSNGVSARFGTTFELSRILTGQIAAGYAQRNYTDARLKSIAAPTLDASLVWTATPLTTLTLRGATTINETTVTNSSGYVTHTGSVEASHALLRNFTIGAVGSVSVNDYAGINLKETTYAATLKADYNLTRSLIFRGSFTHERLQSTAPGSDYTANVFLLGLKLQR